MFNGWQTWKLHTIWDYVFFGLIVACGILLFMAWTAVLKKNRTREKALKRSAERVRKALGAGTEVFTDCELSLNGEREAAELLAVGEGLRRPCLSLRPDGHGGRECAAVDICRPE